MNLNILNTLLYWAGIAACCFIFVVLAIKLLWRAFVKVDTIKGAFLLAVVVAMFIIPIWYFVAHPQTLLSRYPGDVWAIYSILGLWALPLLEKMKHGRLRKAVRRVTAFISAAFFAIGAYQYDQTQEGPHWRTWAAIGLIAPLLFFVIRSLEKKRPRQDITIIYQ